MSDHERELKRNQMQRYLKDRDQLTVNSEHVKTLRAWAKLRGFYIERGYGAGEAGSIQTLLAQLAAAYRHAPDVLDACLTAILADIPPTPEP